MDYFAKIIRSIMKLGLVISGVFIMFNILIVVASVLYRFSGVVIRGTYELIEITIGVSIMFALCYTTMMKGHIDVDILVTRLPRRIQKIIECLSSILSIGFWILIAWASLGVLLERLPIGEISQELKIPLLPLRGLWIFSLILGCLILLLNIYETLFREREVDLNESH